MKTLALTLALFTAPPSAVTTDSLLVIDASQAGDGRYVFVVDVQSGTATLKQIKTIVSITNGNGPQPPLPPPPPGDLSAEIKAWLSSVNDPDRSKTIAGLINGYKGVSDMIADGSLKSADSARRAISVLEIGYLATVGKADTWRPWTDKMKAKLEGQPLDQVHVILETAVSVLQSVR